MWTEYKDGNTVGRKGCEHGVIVQEEEYKHSCRITLEKCEEHYAVTCGIYGCFAHTAFCSPESYAETYEAMKKELQRFIDTDTTYEEELQFYEAFAAEF